MKLNQKNTTRGVAKSITESWAPMIEKTTGIKDPERLSWLSQVAHNTAKNLNEDAFQFSSNASSALGGAYSPYSTLYNTVGVGDAVPAGRPALTGADYADHTNLGSGDKFAALLPLALKVGAKAMGFELVNTTPMAGPTGVLPYMDYVYAGSKQPFGATPAYDAESANPMVNGHVSGSAFSTNGLPSAFKVAVKSATATDVEIVAGAEKLALKENKVLTAGLALAADDLKVEFIGWSRIDGDPMFKVISGSKSLGDYFAKDDVVLTGEGVTLTVVGPRLISMLEDQVMGFAGAGARDKDPWTGTYQDGTVLYDPMSRGTGEMTPARQLSLQFFTRNVTVGTIAASVAVTQEQVQDLQKQWGIDVVKMLENAAINELTQVINRHITSRIFGLGWKNHIKIVEVEGPANNMNITFDPDATTKMTPAFAIPQNYYNSNGNEVTSYTNIALPYKPIYSNPNATFENRDTLIKRIYNNILLASNWIQQRGRHGAGTFVVTNITVATALQSNAHYSFSPIENTINQSAGQLYPVGTVAGMTVYCDPNMAGYDNRVCVGRKGGKDEPGVHFCPYILADSVRIIAENTMAPKLQIKSRYALVDAGYFPETQYVTFAVDMANL
jgi:hypothetical protein